VGVGGVFFRSPDPRRLGEWYAEHLGMNIESWGTVFGIGFAPSEMPSHGHTVWSVFPAETEYFGDSGQGHMINLVVDDIEAALENVAAGGAEIIPQREDHDFGKFGWFVDPDGNRVELWQPPE